MSVNSSCFFVCKIFSCVVISTRLLWFSSFFIFPATLGIAIGAPVTIFAGTIQNIQACESEINKAPRNLNLRIESLQRQLACLKNYQTNKISNVIATSSTNTQSYQRNLDKDIELGLRYYWGMGVSQNYLKAGALFESAAIAGNPIGQLLLGALYYYGHGVLKDYEIAFGWIRLAAFQGNREAQKKLGTMYEYGRGVSKNFEQAFYWYGLSNVISPTDSSAIPTEPIWPKESTPIPFADYPYPIEEFEEVVVSDTRLPSHPIDKHQVPAKVTVITAKEISQSGSKTIQEAVQNSAGTVFYDGVGNNFEQKIELRGYNGDPNPATAVFLDGVRINEPDFGSQNLAFVPLESIERIEIVPGPSAIYGQYALAGVVNLITKKTSDKPRFAFDIMGGSYNRLKETLSMSGPLEMGPTFFRKTVNYLLTVSQETDDQYRENSGARLTKAFGKLSIRPTDTTNVSLAYTYTKNTLGQAGANLSLLQYANNRRQDASPKDFYKNHYNFLTVSIAQQLPLNFSINGNAFYRMLRQRRHTTSAGGWLSDSHYKAESKGGTWQLHQKTSLAALPFSWTISNEYRRDAFNINNGNDSPRAQDSLAGSIQLNIRLFDAITLTSGARYDHTQMNYKDFSGTNPDASKRFSRTTLRSGLIYQFSPTFSLYTNYSEGFRPPTVDEMFNQGSGFNNPSLNSVTSKNYEIGAKLAIGKTQLELAGFWTETRDEIFGTCTVCTWGQLGYDWKNRNVDSTRRRGIEATAKTQITNYFTTTLNYAFTEALFTTNVKFASDRDIQNGDSIELVPKHKLDMTVTLKPDGILQHDFLKHFRVSISALYRSTKITLDDEANTKPRIPGYLLGNLTIRYTHPQENGDLSLFAKIENLGGTKYYSYALLSSGKRYVGAQPTRQAFFGMRYEWE